MVPAHTFENLQNFTTCPSNCQIFCHFMSFQQYLSMVEWVVMKKCMVPLEVLAVYEKKLREATIAIQDRLILQTKEVIEGESFVRILSRKNLMQEQPNQIREAMMKGYVEMSHINLMIASECLHAEYEAQHTVERLVSGG